MIRHKTMRQIAFVFTLALLAEAGTVHAQIGNAAALSPEKNAALSRLDALSSEYTQVAMKIWDWAEVGYQEVRSSGLLQDQLKKAGFRVEAGVAGIPTAFIASFGSGKPIIGILGEFDALPGVSQAAVPMRQERPEVKAGDRKSVV